MNSLRKYLELLKGTESGLTLIEVVVAMFIFAIVSVGVAYSLVMTATVNSDALGRQTASGVATSTIDKIRAQTNFSDVVPSTSQVTVNGKIYTVTVTTNLVGANAGNSSQCSSGSGAPVYKSVNVDVSWQGMSKSAKPVQADTAVAPSARLNDPALGVIVTSVTSASGAGNQGVSVSAVPSTTNPNGATSITSTISPTDSQGCSVVFGVTPGNYVVSISETLSGNPSIDSNQSLAPSFPVTVSAGSSASAPFQFDQASRIVPAYASNYTGGTVILPPGMLTSFTNTYATWTKSTAPYYLHPYGSGYSVIAGTLAANGSSSSSCLSVDPGQWPLSADGKIVGVRQPAVGTAPGGTAAVNVPMGVVSINSLLLSGGYLRVVQQTTAPAGTGNPGCAVPATYVVPIGVLSAATNIALPFGSWAVYSGTAVAQTTPVVTGIAPATLGSVTPVAGSASIVTLDPRTPVTP